MAGLRSQFSNSDLKVKLTSAIHSGVAETTSVCRHSSQLNETDISRALRRMRREFTAQGKAVVTISNGDNAKSSLLDFPPPSAFSQALGSRHYARGTGTENAPTFY